MNYHFILVFSIIQYTYCQDIGIQAYERNNFEKARLYYEKIINERDNNKDAKFGAGSSLFKQNDLDNALEYFNQVVDSDDLQLASKATYNIGNIYREKGDYEKSLASYKRAITLDASNNDAKVNFELLKYMLQNNSQQQQGNEDSSGANEQEQNGQQELEGDSSGANEQEQNGQQEREGDSSGANEQEQNDQQEREGDSSGANEQEQNNQQERKGEDNQSSNLKQDKQEEQESFGGQDLKNEEPFGQHKESESPPDNSEKTGTSLKSDKMIQAEAILDAIKDQEKINQKIKIRMKASKKMEKDW